MDAWGSRDIAMDGENSLRVLFVVPVVSASARPLSLRLQGRSPAAPARPGRARAGIGRWGRGVPKNESVKRGERMTTRTKASVREWAAQGPRPGRRLGPRPLACGHCRARRPTPGDCPRFAQASGCSPLRESPAPRIADQCGWPVQRCRRFFRRESAPSRALPPVASLRDGASATLDCALPRQTHLAPIRLDGADSRPGERT